MTDVTELEEELSIDLHDLENELTQQVDNYYVVSRSYRQAIDRRDTLKKELTEARSTAYFEVRDELLSEEGKATEAMINAKVDLADEVVRLSKELDEAQSELHQWLALKESYDQRSYALNKLVDLYIAGYFGVTPATSAKQNLNDEREKQAGEKYKASKKKSKRKKVTRR